MRIAVAQLNPTLGDLGSNVELALDCARSARDAGADLIVYPAYALAGAWPDNLLDSSGFARDCELALSTFAISCPIPAILGAVVSAPYGGGTLEAVLCIEQSIRRLNLDGFGEPDQLPTVQIAGTTCAVALDWQLAGEDLPARDTDIVPECDLLCVCTAESYDGWAADQEGRDVLQNSLSLARTHGAWLAYANLVGGSDDAVFHGGSGIFDDEGDLVCGGFSFIETVPVATLGEAAGSGMVAGELSAQELDYNALVVATRDYVIKSGFSDVLIGLSGGIDSALVATIAVDALGADHVHGLIMPGPFSSDHSKADASELAANLGIATLEVPLAPVFDTFVETLEEHSSRTIDGLAFENAQARIRGMYLMTLSNKSGWLVLNTGNKSEAAMGYSTLYGDTVGAFAPLADVYKSHVFELALWRNTQREVIPQNSIEKDPSAELYDGQKDEDSLPPYDLLDRILTLHIDAGLGVEDIADRGFDIDLVIDVLWRVSAAEYKRYQEPIGPIITRSEYGFGHTWPIVNRWVDRG